MLGKKLGLGLAKHNELIILRIEDFFD
jgi:hypothetical protein